MTTENVISNDPGAAQAPAPVAFDVSTLGQIDIGGKKIQALDPTEIILDSAKNGRRYVHSAKRVEDMAKSIVSNGQIAPVLVQKNGNGGGYDLILGYRRVMGTIFANENHMTDTPLKVSAIVVEAGDVESLVLNMEENEEHEGLTPIDYAANVKRFIDLGMKKQDIAKKMRKSNPWVTDMVKIGTLRSGIQRKVHAGEIPYTTAVELAGMTDEEQDEALTEIEKGGVTRDQVKKHKKNKKKGGKGKEDLTNPAPTMREFRKDIESLAGLDVEEGKECKFSERVQQVAHALLRMLDGKMGLKALANKLDGVD